MAAGLPLKTILPSDVDAVTRELYAALEYGSTVPPDRQKPTADEIRLRVAAARRMLEEGKSKTLIRQSFHAKWGLSSQTTDNYLACARRQIREDICRSEDDLVAFAHYTLSKIMADPEEKSSARIQATRAFMRLHGLEKPIKIAPTNPEGDKPYLGDAREIVSQMSVEQIAALASARKVVDGLGRVVDAEST